MGGGNTKQHTVLNDTTAQVKLLEGSIITFYRWSHVCTLWPITCIHPPSNYRKCTRVAYTIWLLFCLDTHYLRYKNMSYCR